jgi:lipoate-protein ligase A
MVGAKHLKVIEFGSYPASYNMELDRRLLGLCEADPDTAFLRLYSWSPPALSLGHFEALGAVDLARAKRDGIDVVRRPTGGRIVLHKDDLTYTVVVPRGPRSTVSEVYLELSGAILAGLAAMGAEVEMARGSLERSAAKARPCFLSAARHEITYAGRKLVGSAQRMGRRAVLQHGTIPIGRGYLDVVNYLASAEAERARLAAEMGGRTACLEDAVGRTVDPIAAAAHLQAAFAALLGGRAESWPAPCAAGVRGCTDAQFHGTNTLDSVS